MKQAIQKAIEGGYEGKVWSLSTMRFNEGQVEIEDEVVYCGSMKTSVYKILLDPLFWQALGKAIGWGEEEITVENDNFGRGTTFDKVKISEWKTHWHRFIDHLAEGKSPDDFFKSLLVDKQ